MNSFYNEEELKGFGLKQYGKNVLISKKCSIYSPENIELGNNVRIDDFCILSGTIKLGNYVHISAYSGLYGKFGIEIGNFCGISPRCTILSGTDDFLGNYMISPMVPEKYTNVSGGKIILKDFSQVGVNSVVMPSVTFEEGAVCGAFSFVNTSLKEWSVNTGIPAKYKKNRNNNPKTLSKNFLKEVENE